MSANTSTPNIEQNKARAIASLDGITAQHIEKRFDAVTLESKLRKLENVLDIFEDPEGRHRYLIEKRQRQYIARTEQQIGLLSALSKENIQGIETLHKKTARSEALTSELQNFKAENERLSGQIAQLKAELSRFQKNMQRDEVPENASEGSKGRASAAELINITDELIRANESEIERLREVIANQRASMAQMEDELAQLDMPNRNGSAEKNAETDFLQRCVKESEICIDMLERELNELRTHVKSAQEMKLLDFSEEESEEMSKEVQQLREEIVSSRSALGNFQELFTYTVEALNASSTEDVSLLVYETISGFQHSSQLLIKSPDRTLELSPRGSLSVRDKVMINNMQVGEINPGQGGRMTFRFLNIGGIVQSLLADSMSDSDQQVIVKILNITDKIIALLNQAHKGKLQSRIREELSNSLRLVCSEVDAMIKDHEELSERIINRSAKQILELARARGMTASQVASFNAISQETLKQLETANTLRLKTRKCFVALMSTIEN